jgi:VIT1/CCC1 family predicted Fe2+/Mn2+ transporter
MSEGYDSGSQAEPRSAGFGRDSGQRDRFSDGGPDSQESVGSLISGLLQDLQELVRGEVQLARTEIREDAMTAGRALGSIAAGAFVGVTGFIFLMLGVTYLINKELEMWISAGIVGAVLAIIAAVMISAGRKKLSAGNFKPEQTIETLKEDQEWAKQQMSSVKR